MKNKLLILLIVLATALSLCACTQTIPITRYEKREVLVGGDYGYAKNLSYELALELLAYYRSRGDGTTEYELYLPKEGEFVTEDGAVFVSRVDNVIRYSNRYKTMHFVLTICSPDGTVIVTEELFSSATSGFVVTVSEEMAPYWNIVKALPDELLAQ